MTIDEFRNWVREAGTRHIERELKISAESAARVYGGLAVRRGTLALIDAAKRPTSGNSRNEPEEFSKP